MKLKLTTYCIAFLLAMTIICPKAHAQLDMYKVKSAFVYNFIKFVDWSNSKNPKINVCGLGMGELVSNLKNMNGNTTQGKKLAVRILSNSEPWDQNCDVVVVDKSSVKRIAHIKAGTLTICDNGGCENSSIMFNLLLKNNKVRFKTNRSAIVRSKLKVSSKLLKLSI